MTDTTDVSNEKAAVVADLIRGITNRRWLTIGRVLDADLSEINANQVLLMVVAAGEKHFQSCGRDNWDTYLDMTLEQVSEFLGLTEPETAEDAAA